MNKFERFLSGNIWSIALIFWLVVFWTWLIWIPCRQEFISIQYMLSTIWAIFAFWYWYTKYERDKELEIIKEYSIKYDLIKNDLTIARNKWNFVNILLGYERLLSLFYTEYYLYARFYISESLWLEWKEWIELDLYEIIEQDFMKFVELKQDESYIINAIHKYIWCSWESNIHIKWINFVRFIFSIFRKHQQQIEDSLKESVDFLWNKISENEKKRLRLKIEFIDILLDTWNKVLKKSEEINNKSYNITLITK